MDRSFETGPVQDAQVRSGPVRSPVRDRSGSRDRQNIGKKLRRRRRRRSTRRRRRRQRRVDVDVDVDVDVVVDELNNDFTK